MVVTSTDGPKDTSFQNINSWNVYDFIGAVVILVMLVPVPQTSFLRSLK